MLYAAVKAAEGSHEALQSGPITASTMPACIMRLIADVACVPSQPTCSHTYDSFLRNFSFASATASEMAPADGISSGQESTFGNKTASRITAIDALYSPKVCPNEVPARHKKARHYPSPEREGSTGQDMKRRLDLLPNTWPTPHETRRVRAADGNATGTGPCALVHFAHSCKPENEPCSHL